MLLAPKPVDLDRIFLKDRSVASPGQIFRAVILGVFFALLFIWTLPGGPIGA